MAFNIWDVRSDTPINNFATFNALDEYASTLNLSEGNLKVYSDQATWWDAISTLTMNNSGKYYCEMHALTDAMQHTFGVCTTSAISNLGTGNGGVTYHTNFSIGASYSYNGGGNTFSNVNGSQTIVNSGITLSSSTNDIVGILLDLDNNTVTFYLDNSLILTISNLISGDYLFFYNYQMSANQAGMYANFGQDPTFGGNKTPIKVYTDSNGQGRFFYEPPAGALALCTRNLATPKNVPAEYIVDETNQHLLTYNGNTQVSKFSPYATDGYSLDGMSTGINIGVPSNLISGTGDWSFESWVFLERHVNLNSLFSTRSGNDYSGGDASISVNGTISVVLDYTGTAPWDFNQTTTNVVPLNKWVHICIERYSGDCNVYIDGVKETIGSFGASSLFASTFNIGRTEAPGNQNFKGYMSDIRIKTGGSFYNGTLTVPNAPLSSTDSTLHISSNSKQIIDSSTNSYSLTLTAAPEISDWSPYTSVDKQTGYELVTTENGGSFYFDGSGDNLKTIDSTDWNPEGQDFTVEGWYYLKQTGSFYFMWGTGGSDGNEDFAMRINTDNTINAYLRNSAGTMNTIVSTNTVVKNTWNHIALERYNNVIKIYLNGVADTNTFDATSWTGYNSETGMSVGAFGDYGSGYWNGYIADFRIVKGSAIYQGNFTPPTAKLTAVTNTKYLLQSFQPKDTVNSSFFNVTDNYAQDETGKALTYFGNAAVSTSSPYKSGDYGSFSFGGQNSGDYIDLGNLGTDIVNLTGSYTFEGWVYVIGNTSAGGIITSYDDAASGWRIIFRSNSKIVFEYFNGTNFLELENTTSILNKWTHFVVVSNGTDVAGYIDGVKKATASHTPINGASTGGYTGQLMIGTNALDQASTWNMDGKIADLHFINGTAKYNPSDNTISVPYEPVTVDVINSVLLAQPGKVADSENVAAKDPDAYMKMATWVGDGTTSRTVPHNLGFDPDLVWIKNRDVSRYALIVDSVRGKYNSTDGYKILAPSRTDSSSISTWSANYRVIDKSSTDFTFNGGVSTNENGKKFIAWCWKAGGTPSGGFTGTEAMVDGVETTTTALKDAAGASVTPSAMSVNTKAGFSIVEYTGATDLITIPHGLGKRPSLLIGKNYEYSGANYNWQVHFFYGTNSREVGYLNLTNTFSLDYGIVNDNVIEIFTGDINRSAGKNIAYIWAEIPGYSSIGKWIGNGTTTGDGPFVYTGFKPAFILWQNSDSGTGAWALIDGARDSYNPVSTYLYANADNDESTTTTANNIDFLSNGFKMRGTGGSVTTNQVCWYAAFAEAPTPYATAR